MPHLAGWCWEALVAVISANPPVSCAAKQLNSFDNGAQTVPIVVKLLARLHENL